MFKPRLKIAAALAVALLALAGCASTSTGGGGSSKTVDPAYLSSVSAHVDKLKAPQTDLPPSDGPKAAPGKRIAIVTITLAEAAAKRLTKSLENAVADIGWTSTTYDGQGSPTIANDKLQQAVTTKPDAIVLVALDKTTIGAGLAAAKAAGIPVSCNFCWDLDSADTRGPYADVQPALSRLSDMGKASAEYAFVRTKGHPRFLVFTDPALSNLIARTKGFDQFIDECKKGGDCTVVAKKDFQVANATTTLAADGAALARANPSFNAIWVSFDFAGLQILNGLRQAGLVPTDGSSFMVSSNGDGENLKLIAEGGYQKATVAISFDWGSYGTIDNLNRIFHGQPIAAQNVPIRLFDKSNAGEVKDGAWIADVDFRKVYLDTWKG